MTKEPDELFPLFSANFLQIRLDGSPVLRVTCLFFPKACQPCIGVSFDQIITVAAFKIQRFAPNFINIICSNISYSMEVSNSRHYWANKKISTYPHIMQ